MAGYVASVESWADFSDRWAEALAEPPAISYLHTTDAMALKKDFKGWTEEERDAKLVRLIDVINDTDIIYGTAAVINNRDFQRVAMGHPDPRISDPSWFLFAQALRGLLITHRDLGPKDGVEFIFETMSELGHHVSDIFNGLLFTAPSSVQSLGITNPPTFKGKEFLPLQAADLVVNRVRRHFERYIDDPTIEPDWMMNKLGERGVKLGFSYVDGGYLQSVIDGASRVRAYLQDASPEEQARRLVNIRAWIEGLPPPQGTF
ncbi:MAG: hypothetical protein WCC84_02515 [Candidatus Cybelea sp.]